jgi:hypothetical protein
MLALAAVVAACAPVRMAVRDEYPEPSPRSAGRILGARVGVVEYASACAAAYPALQASLAAVLEHWRLRNDAVVAHVRQRFDASLGDPAERAWFDGELERIARELRAGVAAQPEPERAALCRRYLARLEEGREDVGFKYRGDVAAWLAGP